jgi:hypothetical protein
MNQPTAEPILIDFIPLPSDPAQLTIEHVRMAFVGDWSALKDVVSAAQEVARTQQLDPVLSTE